MTWLRRRNQRDETNQQEPAALLRLRSLLAANEEKSERAQAQLLRLLETEGRRGT